jgi:type II secretory pathway pseudopilin PulG
MKNDSKGITLVEILIVLALSGFVMIGLTRLFKTSLRSYSLQEELTEMNQNVNYSIHKLSDDIMQAGSHLPETNYDVIKQTSGDYDSVFMRVNVFGSDFMFLIPITARKNIPVDDARGFIGLNSILLLDTLGNLSSLSINTSKNTAPCVYGIDTVSNPDTIYLVNSKAFNPGDYIFAAKDRSYFLYNKMLCMDSKDNVIAENIDSLDIRFFDKSNVQTTNWSTMRYCKLFVRGRTAHKDGNYKDPVFKDGYHRTSMSMQILIRNK